MVVIHTERGDCPRSSRIFGLGLEAAGEEGSVKALNCLGAYDTLHKV